MIGKPLPPTLRLYLERIRDAGRPLDFSEIVRATPGVNTFRHLERRGLIVNTVPGYRPDEPYTGPRIPKYALTEAGRRALEGDGKGWGDEEI